jgi:hypothetical protein
MSLVFQNIDPPTPLSARRVCPPPATKAGVHIRLAERGRVNILEDERHRIALLL